MAILLTVKWCLNNDNVHQSCQILRHDSITKPELPQKKEPRASQRDICLQAPAHFHPDVNCNEANAKILQNKLLGITKENKVRLHPEALQKKYKDTLQLLRKQKLWRSMNKTTEAQR